MSLTNTQYETIMREYYDIQSHNKKIAASRRKEISEISPEYDRLAEEIGELSLQTAFISNLFFIYAVLFIYDTLRPTSEKISIRYAIHFSL